MGHQVILKLPEDLRPLWSVVDKLDQRVLLATDQLQVYPEKSNGDLPSGEFGASMVQKLNLNH
jgi:hypothetical protein